MLLKIFVFTKNVLSLFSEMFRSSVSLLLRPQQIAIRGHQGVYRLASSDSSSELILERLSGDDEGIAIIGFNRPKAMNSLSKNLLGLFKDAIDDVKVSLPLV